MSDKEGDFVMYRRVRYFPADIHTLQGFADFQARRIAELEAKCARLEKLHEPMVKFTELAMRTAFDGCDLDGGYIQGRLHALGLLEEKIMSEPCCDQWCDCAATGAEFPTQCCRMVPIPAFIEAREALREDKSGE